MASYFFEKYIGAIIKKNNYKNIVEIGVDLGGNTIKLIDLAKELKANLYCIDPDTQWRPKTKYEGALFIKKISLEGLKDLKEFDCVVVDGDHNWYTVYNELKLIDKKLKIGGTVFLHDVCWPYARRDMYYNPERIPEKYRHPNKKLGIVRGKSELSKYGKNGEYYNATFEGGDKNGVLTAVEDFLAEKPNYDFSTVEEEFGLGILQKGDPKDVRYLRKPLHLKEDNLKLNFDLYTRNYSISKFIQSIGAKPLDVLDVGGRGGFLKNFLNSTTDLTVLDLRENDYSEKNYVVGSILDSKIPDRSFGVVTSSDLLEHIEDKEREKAIEEMLRISRDIVIVAAPFYSPEVEQAEKLVNSYYKEVYGTDHPWLKEHFERVLPIKENLENYLRKRGLDFFSIGSNNINVWQLMQLFLFFGAKFGRDFHLYPVQSFYNKNFLKLGNSVEPTYRKIYFISQIGSLNKTNLRSDSTLDTVQLGVLNKLIMEQAFLIVADHQKQIADLRGILSSKEAEIKSIYDSKIWKTGGFLRKIKNKLQRKLKER